MARFLKLLLLLIVTLVAYVLWGSGITRTIEHRVAGSCRSVPGVSGPEDIIIDASGGMAWIAAIEGEETGLYTWPLDTPDARPVRVAIDGIAPFPPLGMSLWQGVDGERRLFVINRRDHTVEIFRITATDRLQHLRTVADPLIRYPNDVTATGPDAFYVSNTHESAPDTLPRLAEMFLRLERGDVVHVDGTRARVAATGIAYANGNALSPDGTAFYVASVSTSEVYRYRRAPDNTLTFIDTIPVPGGADNIDVQPDGRLTVGLHPRMLDAFRYLSGGTAVAPSRVVQIDVIGTPAVEILYEDPGEELSAASVAPRSGNRLLIGSIRDDHFLDCTLATP